MTSSHDNELCLSSSTCNLYNNKNLPIICSLLVLSPYLFKFISFFFVSPLHFSLVLIFIIATSLYNQKTIIDKLRRPKLTEEQEEEEEDEVFRDFEESEVYKSVFHGHPTLINSSGNCEQLEQGSVMENQEQKMERLFEELDRFEDDSTAMLESPAEISVSRQNIQTVDLETCSSEARMFRSLESIKSDLEKASAMAATTIASSAEDIKTNENENSVVTVKSIISRLESSANFAGYRLTKLDLEEVSSTAISTSGDDETTLKSSSNSCSPSFGSFDSPKSDPEEIEDTKTVENSVKSTSNSMRVELDSCNGSFGSYGSMRKEKEWKRTLACKLFEERRSLERGGEGMDSLWEAYEDDNTRSNKKKMNVKKNNKSKSDFKYFDDGVSEDGDEDDEFMGNGQLCCLKALKMSTGKMNLGMGKPNLVKISKALKGFGWLHHRHAKKC